MTLVKGSAGHCDMSKEADSGIRETAVPSTHDKSMPFLADTGDCFPSRAVVFPGPYPVSFREERYPRIPAFSHRCSLWVKMGDDWGYLCLAGGIRVTPHSRPSITIPITRDVQGKDQSSALAHS